MSMLWHHGRHDNLLSRYPDGKNVCLPLPRVKATLKAMVQSAWDGHNWWFNGTQHAHVPDTVLAARLIVNSKKEEKELLNCGHPVECIVLDDYFGESSTNSLTESIALLKMRLEYCQDTLRIDFSMFPSALAAWKYRNIRRISKRWPFEYQKTHQWLQSIDDRPWQEARMAYDIREMAGASLDIHSAYASAIEHMLFPKPGTEWTILRAGQRENHAMHCIVWEPTDSVGRFYHPFWYSEHGVHAQPGYSLGDKVHCWVLDQDLAWLQRHGIVHGVYQTVRPGAMDAHPLSSSVTKWRQLLAEDKNTTHRGIQKLRLVSSHSWTWQPQEYTVPATKENLVTLALENYCSHVLPKVGGLSIWEEPSIGWVAKDNDPFKSGWCTPIVWIRLHLRSHLMRRIEQALSHGLEIAYVSVDGMHVRAPSNHTILESQNTFVDPLAPWWTWRIDREFLRGFWFRPGSYALQDKDGVWINTNLPNDITGKDWALWCQTRGALDTRKKIGYWRRPSDIAAWGSPPNIAINGQRYFRNIVREHLHR